MWLRRGQGVGTARSHAAGPYLVKTDDVLMNRPFLRLRLIQMLQCGSNQQQSVNPGQLLRPCQTESQNFHRSHSMRIIAFLLTIWLCPLVAQSDRATLQVLWPTKASHHSRR